MSAQLGSSIALWSANGTLVSTSLSMSTSKAAQPPSRFCIASSQSTPRCGRPPRPPASSASGDPLQGQQDHRRVVDVGIEARCGTGSASRSARRPGRRTCQSPGAAHLLVEQPVDRAGAARGGRRAAPASASAIVAIAVSQTGETQGCTRTVPSSSIRRSSSCRSAHCTVGRVAVVAQALAARRPCRSSAGRSRPGRRSSRSARASSGAPPGSPAAARTPGSRPVGPLQDPVERRGRSSSSETSRRVRRDGRGQVVAEQLGDARARRRARRTGL